MPDKSVKRRKAAKREKPLAQPSTVPGAAEASEDAEKVAALAICGIADAFEDSPSESALYEAVAEHLTGRIDVDRIITRWADETLDRWLAKRELEKDVPVPARPRTSGASKNASRSSAKGKSATFGANH